MITKKHKEYSVLNDELVKKSKKVWRQNNSEYNKIYRNDNREELKVKKRKYIKNRYENNSEFKLRVLISRSVNQYLKTIDSSKNSESIIKYLPYSLQELKSHIEKQFESWMTWGNQGKYNPQAWNDNDSSTWTWQLDHIIPQSILKYTSMRDENFKKCWALDNLRPLSAKQNVIDGNRRNND